MKHLELWNNQLSGTPRLLVLPGVVVRVYHCNHVVAVVVAVQVVLQVALQVVVHAKICTDALSVSYLWRTGQVEFEVFMKKKVPACYVFV
jgi:hypothetical protein